MSLIDPVTLALPHLPAALEGLRIAHISDIHVLRPRRRLDAITADLREAGADLWLLTGDYMCGHHDETPALRFIERLVALTQPRFGVFGVFGNHDSSVLRAAVGRRTVRWLVNDCCPTADGNIEVLGLDLTADYVSDSVAMIERWAAIRADCDSRPERPQRPLRLMLAHSPSSLPLAADCGMDVMFAGHTHGGQCRLPNRAALLNSCDLPLRLSSGVLRHRDTLAVVSRGLGEVRLPIRLFCPPHLPVYTLRRGPLPGSSVQHIENVQPW